MKKAILLLITLFCVPYFYAQQPQNEKNNPNPLSNEDFFNQAELVFEGNFVRVVATYDTKGIGKREDIYRISEYKVNKIYKGAQIITSDTIYVVSPGGLLGEENFMEKYKFEEITYIPWVLSKNNINCGIVNQYSTCIFFLTASDFQEDENSKYILKKKYKQLKGAMNVCENIFAGLNDLVFSSREDFYKYMTQFDGFSVPELVIQSEKHPHLKEKNGIVSDSELYKMHEFHKYIMDSLYNAMMKDTINPIKKKRSEIKNSKVDYNTLALQFANKQVTNSGGKSYFEFDIMASSNNPDIFFSTTSLYLWYDYELSGLNMVANGKVTVTKGEHFNNNNDYNIFIYDYFPSTLSINIFPNYSSLNRVKLNTTPTILLHIKIELLSNTTAVQYEIFSSLRFYEGYYSSYTLLSNTPLEEYIYYDLTLITGFLPVIVTNMGSISKVAGVGEVLTIDGENFGKQKGAVFFKAADNGGETYLQGVQDQYIDSWSKTQIKLKVPSKVYKGYGGSQYVKTGGAGTGPIIVKTYLGDTCVSSGALHIPYSIANDTTTIEGDVKIQRVYLAKKNCEHDFLFILNPYFKYNPL